jgi:hypothetical protein
MIPLEPDPDHTGGGIGDRNVIFPDGRSSERPFSFSGRHPVDLSYSTPLP